MAATRALVIMNPVSGQKDYGRLRKQVETYLKDAGVNFDLRETEGEGDAKAGRKRRTPTSLWSTAATAR